MKKTVKLICGILALSLLFSLAACGESGKSGANGTASKQDGNTLLGNVKFSDYVTLGVYKGIEVDTSSDDFMKSYKSMIASDVTENGLDSSEVYSELKTGQVQQGDIANIDYEGKKDGVAFSGGTAQAHDLTIGSHSFIDGFEDGLVGVNIGDTVNLNLKFPELYHSAELAGQAVVFTVKVNYVKRPDMNKIYAKLGFKSVGEYSADLKTRTAESFAAETVVKNSKISGDLSGFINKLFNARCEREDNRLKSLYGIGIDDALKRYGMTKENYKSQMKSELETKIKESLIYYAIIEKEGLKIEYDLPEGEKTGVALLDEMSRAKYVAEEIISENTVIK